jgi:hypothetical protein
MSRLWILLLLAACEPTTKPEKTPDEEVPAEGEGEGEAPTPTYDLASAELVYALPWAGGEILLGGYSGTGADGGFYLADPIGDGASAWIYRLPWAETEASSIEDAAEVVIQTGFYSPDKIGFDAGRLTIPDANATVDGLSGAGIGYDLSEPDSSGVLSDLADVAVEGDTENGYAARTLRIDADGDGALDDLVATQSTYSDDDVHGEIGVWLDVESGVHAWASADHVFPACADVGSSSISYGPVDLAADTDGAHLWVGCPSATYRTGRVELYTTPLTSASEPVGGVPGVEGWTIHPDPRGGVWMGVRGGGALAYSGTDLEPIYMTVADDDSALFGAAPVVVETSTGQVVLAVGVQTRDSVESLLPVEIPAPFAVGDALSVPPDGGSEGGGGVYLCDVTAIPEAAADGTAVLRTCDGYGVSSDSGVTCTGALQALVEREDGLYLGSSGWLFGSGYGCGVQVWRIAPEVE